MRSRFVILGIAALMTVPSFAFASWGGKGDLEPSTSFDRSTFMFDKNDTTSGARGSKVYFNGFAGSNAYVVGATSFNPNFARIGSAHQPYPFQPYAMLGVWKDCNKDGYVGLGDNGAYEYRVELLLGDESVCTRTTLPAMDPRGNLPKNYHFPHNDGNWIRELVPIGWDTTFSDPRFGLHGADANPININDSGSRVWSDWGVPGTPAEGICWVRPQPRGTFHSPASIIGHADCYAQGQIRDGIDDAGAGGAYDSVAHTKPWGEASDASYVEMWDCNAAQTPVANPTNAIWVNVSEPSASPTPNTGGSLAGTANSTGSGFDECDRSARQDGPNHPGNILASAPYSTEGDLSNEIGPRNQTDNTLFFNEGARPDPPVFGAVTAIYQWTPMDGGLRATGSEGLWAGNAVTAASRNPYTLRDLHTPRGISYLTFYAFVSPTAVTAYSLSLPGGSAKYGAEACGTSTTGVRNGWDCDVSHWWRDYVGKDVNPEVGIIGGKTAVRVGAVPGITYNLRDVDCFDESVNGARQAGVGIGLVSDPARACVP